MTRSKGQPKPSHPLFAAAYDPATRGAERVIGPLRASLLQASRGNVLEVGGGTGANLPHYPAGVELTVAEPDPHMKGRGEEKRLRPELNPRWMQAPAEALPFAPRTFDCIVATLVLCTVADPDRALAEIRRVLKPTGRLLFLEHVAAEGRIEAAVQRWLTPVWKRMAAGCHLNRDTVQSMKKAGFRIEWLDVHEVIPLPVRPLVSGIAVPL